VTWDRTKGTDPKYRSIEHKRYREGLVAHLKRDGYLICTASQCVQPTRHITNPNGRYRDGLHAGHNDAGTEYVGPQHNACNVKDGARRARAKQNEAKKPKGQGFTTGRTWGGDPRP
jgi:hypothetical protein